MGDPFQEHEQGDPFQEHERGDPLQEHERGDPLQEHEWWIYYSSKRGRSITGA